VERAPLPIVEVQGTCHLVTYVNAAFCRLIGKTREELRGIPFSEILPGADECMPILERVYQTGKAATHALADGCEEEPACWLYAMWPALDAEHRPVGVIIQLTRAADFRLDVTAVNEALLIAGLRQHELVEAAERHNVELQAEIRERKAAEEALRQAIGREKLAREDADIANRSKDLFLATLSHEMRTPLSAVTSWVGVIRKGGYDPSDVREGLEVIEKCSRAQAQLINDVLDVSSIIAGKLRLDIRPADLVAVINSAVDLLRHAAQSAEVRLEMELDASAGAVSCDPARIQQVVLNLLSNAIKFSSRGDLVKVSLGRDGGLARITVSDSGKGITSDFLPHVFERFRQEESEITRNHGGLGLGLAIVKTLVELHGGTVEARSEGEQHGATFIISLPISARPA
jgi:signal transduction histidine kinase